MTPTSSTGHCHWEKLDESSRKGSQRHQVSSDADADADADATSVSSINFDCNICLELAGDPVVTMCGHLFCWSCLHRWITIQAAVQECPVCKACVKNKIIPLQGRARVGLESTETKMHPDLHRPRRRSHDVSDAAIEPQITGRHSMHSAYLFWALFGIHMIAPPDSSSGFPSCTAFDAESRLPVGGTMITRQLQRLHAHQESIFYCFLFLLGCLASVRFTLF